MKKGLLKIGLGASLLLSSYIGFAQPATSPLHFGFVNGATISNWYTDYVGSRFIVTQPSSLAGEKLHSTATGATWGILPVSAISNALLVKGAPDSSACSGLQNGTAPYASLSGNIAFIYRGNCEFGFKSLQAQNLGAIAVVIVNNQQNGVVGMAGGTYGSQVTIPVYMISKADGDAINAAMNSGDTVRMSITPWGFGNQNDLGFVFNGGSIWHNNSIPNYELGSSNGNPQQYKQIDGAFIANFGTATQHNVWLSSKLEFTPSGSSTASVIKQDSVKIDSFRASDSIVVMYMNNGTTNPYDMHSTGNGRFDITYMVHSNSNDTFPNDNVSKYSFYTTDSIYSKGRYDFANHMPFSANYFSGSASNAPALVGPLYYVNSGGHYAAHTQFSVISIGTTTVNQGVLPTSPTVPIYLFKWVDSPSSFYHDSLIETGELQPNLVGVAQYTFNGTTDSNWGTFTADFQAFPMSTPAVRPALQANTWYWVAADVPQSYAVGFDGTTNYYPRSYGMKMYTNNVESWAVIDSGGEDYLINYPQAPNEYLGPYLFGGSVKVDSVYFGQERDGITPSIPLITSTHSDGPPVAVKNVQPMNMKLNIFPNPATDLVNVTISLPAVAKNVYYNVINNVGRKITSETHYNVQNDKFSLDTHNFAPGLYYVTVIADGTMITREFTILKQ